MPSVAAFDHSRQITMVNPTVVLVLLMVAGVTLAQQAEVVRTTLGSIQGLRKTVLGKDVDVYYGIPYAKPPVGDLRFKRPEPAEPWTGVKSTVTKPNACLQIIATSYDRFAGVEMWNPNTPMSEDCLYLNVWVPRGTGSPNTTMVWIHGGGFISGSSALDRYDGSKLAAIQNVIVASMNYRVGALGFLYTGTPDAPGNQGLLDQTLALKWIHDNIESFGGAQDSITIFGESAGSISVGLHLLSPRSRDYFTRAIMESGSPASDMFVMPNHIATQRAEVLSAHFGCKGSIQCLRDVNAVNLTYSQGIMVEHGRFMDLPATPVVDGFFLTKRPSALLEKGDVKNAELLIGVNKDEGFYFLVFIDQRLFPFNWTDNISDEEFKNSVHIINGQKDEKVDEALMYEYMKKIVPDMRASYRDIADDMSGDLFMICPTVEFATAWASRGRDVFLYWFQHRLSTNPWPQWMGVMHGYEIELVFGLPLNATYTEDDQAVSDRMMAYWTRFAKTGNPNGGDALAWPKLTSQGSRYLGIHGSGDSVGQGLRYEQCAFRREVLPLIARPDPVVCPTGKQASITSAPSVVLLLVGFSVTWTSVFRTRLI